ncbi:MAG: hypothetical protein U0103_05315 [Candidatus Obscuribacterales bacterium]
MRVNRFSKFILVSVSWFLSAPQGFAAGGQQGVQNYGNNGASKSTPSQNAEVDDIRNSASKISAQTTENEAHASEEYDARIRDVNRDADRRIADLQREQAERIEANRPIGLGRGAKNYNPTADNNAVKEEIAARIQRVKEEQARRIAEFRALVKARQTAAEEAAITLDTQYVNRDLPGSVRLAPSGTNAYVRNYETSDEPSGNAVPLALPPARSLGTQSSAHAALRPDAPAQAHLSPSHATPAKPHSPFDK